MMVEMSDKALERHRRWMKGYNKRLTENIESNPPFPKDHKIEMVKKWAVYGHKRKVRTGIRIGYFQGYPDYVDIDDKRKKKTYRIPTELLKSIHAKLKYSDL